MFTSPAAWWYDKNIFGNKWIFIMGRKGIMKRIGMRRLAAFAAAALVLCLAGCGELFEKPDTLRHAALMMTDLDNLKKTINDTYGHDWGDVYLRQTAHSLRQNSPGGTVVARLSGVRAGGHRRKGRRGHRRGGTPEGRAGRSLVLKSKKYRPLHWHCAGTEGDFLSIFTE